MTKYGRIILDVTKPTHYTTHEGGRWLEATPPLLRLMEQQWQRVISNCSPNNPNFVRYYAPIDEEEIRRFYADAHSKTIPAMQESVQILTFHSLFWGIPDLDFECKQRLESPTYARWDCLNGWTHRSSHVTVPA